MSERTPFAPAFAEALRALRPSNASRRPAILLVEAAAAVCAYAASVSPAARAADSAQAAGLLATAYLVALVPALAEAGARARAGAWLKAGVGLRTRQAFRDGSEEPADGDHMRAGDWIVVQAGEIIPADGTVLEGAATVDESALTGESAPVLREAVAPRARVIGGSLVLSDRLKIQVDGEPGQGLLRRLALRVEGALGAAARRETVLAAAALLPAAAVLALGLRGGARAPADEYAAAAAFVALLLPASLTALSGAAGSLGVRRLLRAGVLARDAAAVDAAARAQTVILEESAAATGRRRAAEFIPAPGIPEAVLADAAQLTCLLDESPEGRSIIALAKTKGLRGRRLSDMKEGRFVPLSPHTHVSGVDVGDVIYRRGPAAALSGLVGGYSPELASAIDRVRRTGGEAIAVAQNNRALGVINMREPEPSLRERVMALRAAGVRAVLSVRADAPAAQALRVELGVDENSVAAEPAAREAALEREQASGRRTAAAGDAADDAGLLAKCGVAVARGLRGTPAADAALLDLREDPAQVVDAVAAARAARRARAVLDAAAWLCDALKGAGAAFVLVLLMKTDMAVWTFNMNASVIVLALALTALGLLPLLLLAAAALTGRL